MVETGSYNVNKKGRDSSFKSFICALLAFLAMLILISLLLFAFRNRGTGSSDDLGKKNDKYDFDFLQGKNKTKKENETSTRLPTTTVRVTSTSSREFEKIVEEKSTTEEISTTTQNIGESQDTTLKTTTAIIYPNGETQETTQKTTTEFVYPDGESQDTTPKQPETTTTVAGVPVPKPTVTGSPVTCKDGICKRAASSMLAIMNHEDKIDRCEDYYKFICEGPEQNDEHAFFHHSFKGFIKKINEVTPTSEKYLQLFADFYKSCNQFGNSINRLERLKYLKGTEGATLTEVITKSILSQSMPFFDIGLNIQGKNFILEVTLPGLNYLKTILEGWSLVEQLKEDCITEQADKINQNIIDLDKISTDIKTCIGEKTTKYINDFVEEMKQLSTLAGFEFLEENVKAAVQSSELIEILNTVQESIAIYRSSNSKKLKETTLADLKTNYEFGLDWIELFKGITKDVNIDEKTVVYLSEHLEEVFKKLIEKKANLQQLLNLWYNIELYKNTVIEKQIDNRGYHCLEVTAQLMPDVSSAIISELNTDKTDLYKEAQNLMKNLTVNVYTSVVKANMTRDSAKIIQDRLSEIDLITPQSVEVDGLNYLSAFDLQDPYPKKLVTLLSHFRKVLFSLDQTVVVGEPTLKYFVNAFATKPKTFPPSRLVVFQPGFLYGKSTKLPMYVKIAKLGLPLSMQISRHFTKNDFGKPLDQREKAIYEDMEKTFDTKYLMNKVKYTVENIDFEVEDGTGNHLSYDDIFADNMAFGLEVETFRDDKELEYLPFLNDYTREQSFNIIALQEYCHENTLADFIGDYYNRYLPAPVKFKNMMKNSQFYADAFKCTDNFERKQFPYIKPSTP